MQIRVKRRPLAEREGAQTSRAAADTIAARIASRGAAVLASPWLRVAVRVAAGLAALAALSAIGVVASARAGAATPGDLVAASAATEGAPAPTGSQSPALVVPSSPSTLADAASPIASTRHEQARVPGPRTPASPEDPVVLNQAGVEDLRRLPGVGAKRAAAILALREKLGRFQRVDDLLRVRGVGRNTLRKWRPLLRLDPPAGDAGA